MSAQAQSWNDRWPDPEYDEFLDRQRDAELEDLYWSMRAEQEEQRMKEEGVF